MLNFEVTIKIVIKMRNSSQKIANDDMSNRFENTGTICLQNRKTTTMLGKLKIQTRTCRNIALVGLMISQKRML